MTYEVIFFESKRNRKINEDANNRSLRQVLNTKIAYSASELAKFGAPTNVQPDVSIIDIDSAVYFNTIEVEDIAESFGNELAKKIVLDCLDFVKRDWFTDDGIYYYKTEEAFERFSEE